MCSYKTLAHGIDGYIILCNECEHFQIAFGTSAVKFDAESYSQFSIQIETLTEIKRCSNFCNQKNIHIDLNCSNTMMVLNYSELKKLSELVNQANFTLEMITLLEQNNIE